eukprot:gb/GEZN01013528.1/.p1 GENE.gb/GEZN01013528.1/~~gb/GEZN01013528.1/.p1  ORF type:complete len:201 (-),score=32.11 gb/GEZN01013528.1/:166-768(-)
MEQGTDKKEVSENFAMSQFWYTEDTSTRLAKEALLKAGPGGRIACISCPSLFKALEKLLSSEDLGRHMLLEFDRRFEVYHPSFCFYDFKKPKQLPAGMLHAFDYVVADPPYLNQDCMGLVAQTITLLAKSAKTPAVFNTGAVLQDPIRTLLGWRPARFHPEHSCKLSNEFRTYTSYDATGVFLQGWETDDEPDLDEVVDL